MKTISTRDSNDILLLEGLKQSDGKIIEEIYNLVLPSVIQWVKENNGTETDARDIFQDGLIALFRKLKAGDFVLTCTLKSYLRIVCRNMWLTKIRNRKNKKLSPLTNIEPVVLDEGMIENIERTDKERIFFKHFDQLDEKCQKIMSLFFNKVSLGQIAEQMGNSVGYIKKRKFLCKEKLVSAVKADPLFLELRMN